MSRVGQSRVQVGLDRVECGQSVLPRSRVDDVVDHAREAVERIDPGTLSPRKQLRTNVVTAAMGGGELAAVLVGGFESPVADHAVAPLMGAGEGPRVTRRRRKGSSRINDQPASAERATATTTSVSLYMKISSSGPNTWRRNTE